MATWHCAPAQVSGNNGRCNFCPRTVKYRRTINAPTIAPPTATKKVLFIRHPPGLSTELTCRASNHAPMLAAQVNRDCLPLTVPDPWIQRCELLRTREIDCVLVRS